MQKHFKRTKKIKMNLKRVLAVFSCLLLLVSFFAVESLAIKPPIDDGLSTIVYDEYIRPTRTDCEAIYDVVHAMYELNYFQFGSYMYCYYDGERMCLAVSRLNYGDVTVNETSIVSDTMTKNVYVITETGFRYLSSLSGEHTVPLDSVLCYLSNGNFVYNIDNFTTGSGTSASFQNTATQWREFYGKVSNYDENITNSYNSGYGSGAIKGEAEGYANGLQAGREEGYSTGYDSGYETGLTEGNANAENRYLQGKSEGLVVGYGNGYTAGYDVGYDEGYDEGYEACTFDGDDVFITEELDVASIISALPQAARNILDSAFGFELFGINIASTLTAILLVAIVVFVIRWLMSR